MGYADLCREIVFPWLNKPNYFHFSNASHTESTKNTLNRCRLCFSGSKVLVLKDVSNPWQISDIVLSLYPHSKIREFLLSFQKRINQIVCNTANSFVASVRLERRQSYHQTHQSVVVFRSRSFCRKRRE